MSENPAGITAEDSSPHYSAAYCYVLVHPDGETKWYAGHDRDIALLNLPAFLGAASPQVFGKSQIRHSRIRTNDRYEDSGTAIMVPTDNIELQRVYLTSAPVQIKAYVIRVASDELGNVAPEIDFATNAMIVTSGVLSGFIFEKNVIAATLTPEPFYTNAPVPRMYFQRECNHQLYGPGCRLDKADFAFESEIVSVNPAQKEIVILGRKSGEEASWFEAGLMAHDVTGMKLTIGWAEDSGASDTKLKMLTWSPEFAPGQTLTAYAGCARTVAHCRDKFDNVANFGGFPTIPNRNIVINGAAP